MESVEQFMRDFFKARSAEIKRELEARYSFRQRFFAGDCMWDSREGALERSENEVVLSVSVSNTAAQAITREIGPLPKLRYNLGTVDTTWLIQSVDVECPHCVGTAGNKDCIICFGKGWSTQADLRSISDRADQNARVPQWRQSL